MKRTVDWQKWVAISTIILAFAAVVATAFAAYGTRETRRMVETTQEMLEVNLQMVEVTREMLQANVQAAEINNEILEANLLSQRYQLLKGNVDEHRTKYHVRFQQYIWDLAEDMPKAPSGFDLVNDEYLCSKLGSCEWICTTFHEYDRALDRAKALPYQILRSLQARDFASATEQLDTLEANLTELRYLYREVFFPGKTQDR